MVRGKDIMLKNTKTHPCSKPQILPKTGAHRPLGEDAATSPDDRFQKQDGGGETK